MIQSVWYGAHPILRPFFLTFYHGVSKNQAIHVGAVWYVPRLGVVLGDMGQYESILI